MLRLSDFHDYQHEGVEHIFSYERCALWMPMGGGKTATTLTALDMLSLTEDVWPTLVLAPLRVARGVWPQEPGEWEHLQHLTVQPIIGTDLARRRRLENETAHIYTLNYDNLPWLVKYYEEIGKPWPFKTVVADEATRLRSFRLRQGGKRANALGKVAWNGTERFIELTGTPAPKGLVSLWGQLWFLDKGQRLGRTYTAFDQRWFTKGWDGFSVEPMPHAQKEISDLVSDICRTIVGMPVDKPIFVEVECDIGADVRRLYREMEKEFFIEIANNEVAAANSAVKSAKLHQLVQGAVYINDKMEWREVDKAKLDALKSVIEEAAGMPVLVAYKFQSDLARLKAAFPRGKVLGTDPKVIKDWNDGKIPLLFAHPASAGHGLNLARGGNILAFFALDWDLELFLQIIERIGPMRQKQAGFKRPVFVYLIKVKNSIDDLIHTRLITRRSVQDLLLEAARKFIREL